jgi:hypothetical protein
MVGSSQKIQNAKLLISRLERLSADSIWAHKASGLRGSLLRCLERIERTQLEDPSKSNIEAMTHLSFLLESGFDILQKAAKEITYLEDLD